MIKRRFYNIEHGGDGDSASFSSSSDSENFDSEDEGGEQEDNGQRAEEEEEEQKEVAAKEEEGGKPASESPSTRSSSLLVKDYDVDSRKEKQNLKDNQVHECHPEENKRFGSKSVTKTIDSEDSLQAEMSECVLKCKSVFKCRICPRIVCLCEDTLLTHLRSKRHARSKKLLGEGRLKLMLNSDGEIEEEEETHAERHARIVTLVQPKKKNKGRQRQNKRRKMLNAPYLCKSRHDVLLIDSTIREWQKARNGCDGGNTNSPQKKQKTKRCKIED